MTRSAGPGPGGWRWAGGGSPGAAVSRSARGRASFPTPIAIGEGLMQRQWQARRRMRPAADGARRWDRTYLLILGWGAAIDPPAAPGPGTSFRREQEVEHDGGGLRARVDPAPSAGADHRAAARAAARPSARAGRGAGEREHLPR